MTNNTNDLLIKIPDKEMEKIQSFQGVMVACSGGLDSTVLLENLCQIQENQKKIKIAVTHVNFHLRNSESDGDQNFVADLCEKWGIEIVIFDAPKLHPGTTGESTQEWARRVRYGHFEKLKAQGWLIAMAHHHGDVAENVLFRMSRGSYPENLIGMQRLSNGFYRPLLSTKRCEIEEYAARHKVRFRHDSSNDKLTYSRNKIRLATLPILEDIAPGASAKIVTTAEESREYGSILSKMLVQYASCKDLKDCALSLRLYLEGTSNKKLTMTKPEWSEVHKWFQRSTGILSSKEMSCSLGTLVVNADGMPSLLTSSRQIRADEDAKSLCSQKRVFTLSPGSSVKVEINAKHFTFAVDSAKPVEVNIISFHAAVRRKDKKLKERIKKYSNEFLRLSQVEQENAIIVESSNGICLIDAQGELFALESTESVQQVQLANVTIFVG
jgi:tRNA(Ile)-lysidine synthetase-like protein